MAKPFNEALQERYTFASKLIRAMDEVDGGPEPPLMALQTAIFALEAGLITAIDGRCPLRDTKEGNSAFDALVILHELRERLSVLFTTHPTQTPMPEQRPRRFASLTRTANPDGTHTLDAIDQYGRAWFLVVGNDEAPATWTELQPLPGLREAGHE